MKNALFAIALASAGFAALPATSHAADTSGFFINGSVGRSDLSKGAYDDNDTGYLANIGYRWAVAPNLLLGVEGGYTNLGKFKPDNDARSLGDAKLKGYNLGVNGHWNFTDNWYVSGRTGFFRSDVKGGYFDGVDPVSVDDHASKWYAGGGVGYDFSNNVSVGVNYDYYKADKSGLDFNPSLVSVSGEYRF